MSIVRVAVVQHDIVWEDPEATITALRPWVAAAVGTGARLVVLAEMFATGFSMNTERTAERADGPATTFLVEQATEHGVWLCGSVARWHADAPLPTNTLVVAAPDGSVHTYRKLHPFSYAQEHRYFAAGHEFVTVAIEGVRCTLFVCYDLRFADEFWTTAADTDCYLVVANWPQARRHHWTSLLSARAIENQAYVVGCNRIGAGGGLDYAGDSRIIDPMGEILASGAGVETLLVADVDAAVVAATRERFPFFADRR